MSTTEVAGSAAGRAWRARPWVATAVRAALVLAPVAAAVVVTSAASRVLTEPGALAARIAWFAGLCALSTVTVLLVDRWGRRYLPITTLLRLSLVFPDKAPSRFRSAMRLGSVRHLEQQLALGRQGGRPGEPIGETAARVVELATSMRRHDRRTRGHMERVRVYADMIGEEMGLSEEDRHKLHWGALLHDIGKLEVPGEILNKPGRPSPEEWEVLRGHPDAARPYLEPLLPWLGAWAAAAWEHHERYDGTGYPRQLAGREITLSGRIVAAADAFEVLTATRSYKRPVPAVEARAEIARCAGTHFDPDVARALLSISIGRLRPALGPLAWVAQLPFLGWSAPTVASLPSVASSIGRTVALAGALSAAAPGVAVATVAAAPPGHRGTIRAAAMARHRSQQAGTGGSASGGRVGPVVGRTSVTSTGGTAAPTGPRRGAATPTTVGAASAPTGTASPGAAPSTTSPPAGRASTTPPATGGPSSPPTTGPRSSAPTTSPHSSPPTTGPPSSPPTTGPPSSPPTTGPRSSPPTTVPRRTSPPTTTQVSTPSAGSGGGHPASPPTT